MKLYKNLCECILQNLYDDNLSYFEKILPFLKILRLFYDFISSRNIMDALELLNNRTMLLLQPNDAVNAGRNWKEMSSL